MTWAASVLMSALAVYGWRVEISAEGLVPTGKPVWALVIAFVCFAVGLRFAFKDTDKRRVKYAAVYALILAVFWVVGSCFEKMGALRPAFIGKRNMLKHINLVFSYWTLYFCIAWALFNLISRSAAKESTPMKPFSWKRVLIIWAVFLVYYFGWYLYCYPGNMTYDTGDQIRDAISHSTLSDHHSAFLTLLIRLVLDITYPITGSYQLSVGILTLLQMLIMTFLFALAADRAARYAKHTVTKSLIFLYLGAYPIHNLYTVTLWKDILFSGCVLAFMLCVDSALHDEEGFFKKKSNCLLMFLSMALMPLMRHNGIAISIGMAVVMLICFKRCRKSAAVIVCAALAFYAVWKLAVCPQIVTSKSSSREALCVPMQQAARIFREHRDELDAETIAAWQTYFTEPEFWTKYSEILADPVKKLFISERFDEDPGRFIRLWFDLVKRYPLTAIEAFLHNNFGYWYPDTFYWISSNGVIITGEIGDIHTQPLMKLPWVERIFNWYAYHEYRSVPFGYLFTSRGFCFWIWLFCGAYCLYNNRRKFPLFMVGFLLWASILISPVYAEFRYVYGLFIGLPVIMASTLSARGHQQVIGDGK